MIVPLHHKWRCCVPDEDDYHECVRAFL
eukprot:COSAG04_NODE_22751_length_349_cov_1.440000_2_plen_27_part_01